MDKCEKLCVSKVAGNNQYKIGNTSLQETDSVKDLGIYISKDLKWDMHINKMKIKANQRCFLILKSFQTKNIWILLRAYLTYVRPIAEYGSVVWSPHLNRDIDSVESIQRSFTMKIFSRCNIQCDSYKDRLFKLNLRSLQYRRVEADLIMAYKILHNIVDIPMSKFFALYVSPYSTRRHRYCLKRRKTSTKLEQNSFANRIVPIWNRLPEEIVLSATLNIFRSKIKSFDLHSITQLKF